jgi:alkylhydroperoxidase/carboxymuconolactone decarboxylase family protein
MAWYNACQENGALSRREKSLIGLAVAHALQCPYCIDAFSQACLESGSNMEQMTEAIHMASALRGGATLIHGIQAHNSVDKVNVMSRSLRVIDFVPEQGRTINEFELKLAHMVLSCAPLRLRPCR